MKKSIKVLLGLIITVFIYIISILISRFVNIPIDFIPSMFLTHITMGISAIGLIYYFHTKGYLIFKMKRIKIRLIFKVILISIVAFIILGILINVFFLILDIPVAEKANPFSGFYPLQFLVFVVILASTAEELLFRGFLLNILEPLRNRALKLYKLRISISSLISGGLFGLAHLILLTSDASLPFVLRIVITTSVFGIIAGHLQEKHENNFLLALIVHMTVNSIGLIVSIITMP